MPDRNQSPSWNAALLLTMGGVLMANITLANSDYRWVLRIATFCSMLALVFLAICWAEASRPRRVIIAALIYVNAWALLASAGS